MFIQLKNIFINWNIFLVKVREAVMIVGGRSPTLNMKWTVANTTPRIWNVKCMNQKETGKHKDGELFITIVPKVLGSRKLKSIR